MSELEDRLNAVLSNPEEMSRLADMASKLMGQLAPEGGAAAPPGGGDGSGGLSSLAGLSGLAGLGGAGLGNILSRVLGGQNGNGKKALADALSPYLSHERAQRLARALRIASAARIAMAAFSEWGRNDGL